MSKKKIIYQPPGAFEEHRFEKLHNVIFDSSLSGSRAVADEIATLIRQKQDEGLPCVLGLATGSSPISVYNQLIKLHQDEGLSFKNVITFNLDEYFGLNLTILIVITFLCTKTYLIILILKLKISIFLPETLIEKK